MIKIGKNIDFAKDKLDKGGLVAIPTETVYGLGGNALNLESVDKIFNLKNRPSNDPLICHTNSISKIEKYVNKIPDVAYKLAEKFWPGPLTLIFEKKEIIPNKTTSNLKTVGFRIPNKEITLDLLKNLDYPISAPSANKFGYISPTRTEHIFKNFSQGIDYVLDGGACELGIESTIIGFENKNTIVYRLGSLVVEDIEKYVGDITIYSNEENFPGSFKSHYSPSKKLYLGDIKMLKDKFKDKRIGVLCFDKYYDFIKEKNQILLSKNSSLFEASKNLYSSLYELDNMKNIDIILSTLVEDTLIGRTINNRLIKSAEDNDEN
ncbi:MAG: threonylcarbamoyl-AMP synthase [Flammeovirgaceae bacterium]|nr:threonylcarbamoyl-AMP synthase [Flammeovirgaceae bacterium]